MCKNQLCNKIHLNQNAVNDFFWENFFITLCFADSRIFHTSLSHVIHRLSQLRFLIISDSHNRTNWDQNVKINMFYQYFLYTCANKLFIHLEYICPCPVTPCLGQCQVTPSCLVACQVTPCIGPCPVTPCLGPCPVTPCLEILNLYHWHTKFCLKNVCFSDSTISIHTKLTLST